MACFVTTQAELVHVELDCSSVERLVADIQAVLDTDRFCRIQYFDADGGNRLVIAKMIGIGSLIPPVNTTARKATRLPIYGDAIMLNWIESEIISRMELTPWRV